ncbi:hypothetical protein [Rhodococcus sp. Eu-32]|uniref:hypothetical protein n=1 Tax=Rhodococcus sp. Eu-32 TaxID=1017319 RepID=UPI0014023085|nr:hypothetical protein [Rhodococcus sp. Eu-32]
MPDEHDFTFRPAPDEGQAGWVTLPDGRRAYRYLGSDDLIIDESATAPGLSDPE